MELEGSLPWSQEPSTGPYPEPHPSNPIPPRSIIGWLLREIICVYSQNYQKPTNIFCGEKYSFLTLN
jgi:hypothetical protein